jgi:hypothetical protein
VTRRDLDAIRSLVRKEIERTLADRQPPEKRLRIPCGTGNGNWPRCMGSAAIGSGGCTCGASMARLVRSCALWIAWIAARGAVDAGQLDAAEVEQMQRIADEIGEACGWRTEPEPRR